MTQVRKNNWHVTLILQGGETLEIIIRNPSPFSKQEALEKAKQGVGGSEVFASRVKELKDG